MQTTQTKLEILYPAGQIAGRVAELGAQISRDYAGQSILLAIPSSRNGSSRSQTNG